MHKFPLTPHGDQRNVARWICPLIKKSDSVPKIRKFTPHSFRSCGLLTSYTFHAAVDVFIPESGTPGVGAGVVATAGRKWRRHRKKSTKKGCACVWHDPNRAQNGVQGNASRARDRYTSFAVCGLRSCKRGRRSGRDCFSSYNWGYSHSQRL